MAKLSTTLNNALDYLTQPTPLAMILHTRALNAYPEFAERGFCFRHVSFEQLMASSINWVHVSML